MSTTLFNATNEDLEAQHIGVTTIIKKFPEKGHMVLVDDAKARHLLNILAPRGLTTLDYGDEGDAKKKKAAEGRKRNKEFKIKQIVDFNQNQQQNEANKISYSHPTEALKQYSDELGLDLIKPYELPNIEKGKRVIAGKTYQFLSVGVPTIVGDNPANRELRNQENWSEVKDKVIFSKVGNPDALAKTIIENYEKWKK